MNEPKLFAAVNCTIKGFGETACQHGLDQRFAQENIFGLWDFGGKKRIQKSCFLPKQFNACQRQKLDGFHAAGKAVRHLCERKDVG